MGHGVLLAFPSPRSGWSSLDEVVSLGIQLALTPAAAAEVCQGIAARQIRLPGRSVLMRARNKIDILMMYYQRKLNHESDYVRHLAVDASPQVRHNFLCMRERSFKVPSDLSLGSSGYVSRSLPCTALGYGRATLTNKIYNITHAQMLECGSMEAFSKYRFQVRSLLSDSGVERGLADSPVVRDARTLSDILRGMQAGELSMHGATDAFLYPNCVYIQGHLHIIYNALQAGVEKLPTWTEHVELLRGVNNFLKDLGLRQRFQTICMKKAAQAEIRIFDNFKPANVDWKWEWLGILLKQLHYMFPILARYWDKQAMGTTSRAGGLTAQVFKMVDMAVKTTTFQAMNAVLLAVAKTVERIAHRLEGCPCHEELWTQPTAYAVRSAELRDATGFGNCPWKGCWGSLMALGLHEKLIAQVMAADSPEMVKALGQLASDDRTCMVAMEQQLKASIAEELAFRWGFWKQIPYRIMGAYAGAFAADSGDCQECIRDCLQQYDCAKAAGNINRVHRVAVRILDEAGPFRAALSQLATGDFQLEHFPELRWELFSLSSACLMERSLEGEHAKIKKLATGREGIITPATVAALLRAPEQYQLLEDQLFVGWATSVWHKELLIKTVLKPMYPVRELLAKSLPQVYSLIYLYDRHAQHRDTAADDKALATWNSLTDRAAPLINQLTWQEKLLIDYVKTRCSEASTFALPQYAMELATSGAQDPRDNEHISVSPQCLLMMCMYGGMDSY